MGLVGGPRSLAHLDNTARSSWFMRAPVARCRLGLLAICLDKVDASRGSVDPDQLAASIGQARRRQQHEELLGRENIERPFDFDLGAGVRDIEQDAASPPGAVGAHQVHGLSVIHAHPRRLATVEFHYFPADLAVRRWARAEISPQRTDHWLVER